MKDITLEELGRLAIKSWRENNRHLDLIERSFGEDWDNDPTGCCHITESSKKCSLVFDALNEAMILWHYQEGKFDDDEEAHKFLEKQGFKEVNGVIFDLPREKSKAEKAAINYLCFEWDYGFKRL